MIGMNYTLSKMILSLIMSRIWNMYINYLIDFTVATNTCVLTILNCATFILKWCWYIISKMPTRLLVWKKLLRWWNCLKIDKLNGAFPFISMQYAVYACSISANFVENVRYNYEIISLNSQLPIAFIKPNLGHDAAWVRLCHENHY